MYTSFCRHLQRSKMTQQEAFGGPWTQDKLSRLKAYLAAYMDILKKQPWATTVYVDAFAGTGVIPSKAAKIKAALIDEPSEPEIASFITGSARVALSVDPPFGHYLFIELSARKVKELETLKEEFPHLKERIQVENAEANEYLMQWIATTNWKSTRAVVFLDPCGMQVEWRLLEALGKTKAIDLWLLVPIGMGVNRMLTQNELPPQDWQDRLTTFFGTDAWVNECYRPSQQGSLFGEDPSHD
jgi:three-Cys-motif partner protein